MIQEITQGKADIRGQEVPFRDVREYLAQIALEEETLQIGVQFVHRTIFQTWLIRIEDITREIAAIIQIAGAQDNPFRTREL